MTIRKKHLSSHIVNSILEKYDEPFLKEFLKKVWIDRETECWFIREDWSEYTTYHGQSAHRYSFKVFNPNESLRGVFVCHKCDRRGCVNPKHLFTGTHSDNMKDMRAKKRTSFILNHKHRGLDELKKKDRERNLRFTMHELKYFHGYPNRD